jgi:hypothetical protein
MAYSEAKFEKQWRHSIFLFQNTLNKKHVRQVFANSEYDKGFIQFCEPCAFQADIRLNKNIVKNSLLTES